MDQSTLLPVLFHALCGILASHTNVQHVFPFSPGARQLAGTDAFFAPLASILELTMRSEMMSL
jgi:hypothetical protein